MSARTVLSFSRDLEFVSQTELAKRMGCQPERWLRATLKELIDNALDACEEAGEVDPEIKVDITGNSLSVSDNGPGIPPELVARLCDRSRRTSTREAYAAPDRGSQGNALQTIMCLQFGLGLDVGRHLHRQPRRPPRDHPAREPPRPERRDRARHERLPRRAGHLRWPDLARPALPRRDLASDQRPRMAESARRVPPDRRRRHDHLGSNRPDQEVDARPADPAALVHPRPLRPPRAPGDRQRSRDHRPTVSRDLPGPDRPFTALPDRRRLRPHRPAFARAPGRLGQEGRSRPGRRPADLHGEFLPRPEARRARRGRQGIGLRLDLQS